MPFFPGRLKILNLWVDPVTMEQALDRVVAFVEEGDRPHAIFAVNPEKNYSVPKNRFLLESFRSADLLIPDGIGVVMAARFLHGAKLSRVPGVELMERICRLAAGKGYRVFLFGADEDVSRKAVEVLQERYPGLRVVGRANGFRRDDEMTSLVERINASEAQVLFLALGSPRQEQWYATHRDALRTVRVCQGIGGTLDVVAGKVRRAPEIWCRWDAEWLYRLLSEPTRIRRQTVLPVFAAQVLLAKLKGLLHGQDKTMRIGA